MDELRFLVTRILGPRRQEDSPVRLSDLQTMLHARPDARMERWVQNLTHMGGGGDPIFTAELLLSVLQSDA